MPADAPTHRARVTVRADRRTPLRRIWRYVGYDEVNYTTAPGGRELLAKLGALRDAPYHVRAHFLLCSGDESGARPKWGATNVYAEDAQGRPVYHWETIDGILDAILEAGCVPFVELGFMPQALTTAPDGVPYDDPRSGGWRYPPRDYRRWEGLVAALAAHCAARYGLRVVGRWYWELWNEPDIFYWAGTVQEYCRLYDHTVAGLDGALSQARVGGPATTNPGRPDAGAFLRAFLAHCARGTNAVTGQRGTRLDFVSFHSKGNPPDFFRTTEKRAPSIGRLVSHVATGLGILGEFPELAGREVILSECDPDGLAAASVHDSPNVAYRNTAYYASYVATALRKLLDLGAGTTARVDGMLTWAFEFEGRGYFEGLRTLSTNGADKPVLNVFRALAELGGARADLSSDAWRDPLAAVEGDAPDAPPDVGGLAACDGRGGVQVLLASHHDDSDVRARTTVTLDVRGLQPGRTYRVERYTIDSEHSNAHTVWLQMGAPQAPTPEERGALRRAGELALAEEGMLRARADGSATAELDLEAHAVALVMLRPA